MSTDKDKRKNLKNQYLDGKFNKRFKGKKVEEEFYDSLTEWIDYKLKQEQNQNK
jgi:hypothetical protein